MYVKFIFLYDELQQTEPLMTLCKLDAMRSDSQRARHISGRNPINLYNQAKSQHQCVGKTHTRHIGVHSMHRKDCFVMNGRDLLLYSDS